MTFTALVVALPLLTAQPTYTAQPAFGGPEIHWTAPGMFVQGQPYKVHVEIVAPKEGTVVASWLLGPSAFTIDGKGLGKREDAGTLTLPSGFRVEGDVDLAAYLPADTAEFKLGYASEVADSPPVVVKALQAAPTGLDFMKMPAADLSKYHVVLETNQGNLEVEFWPDDAPNHVRNFRDLAYTGFYDGTTFQRVIPGFMIQGGDPTGTGTGDGKRRLKAEFNKRKHEAGVLSMARSSNPDSASCQFFVMHARSPHLDGQYSAFGKLTSGIDVVEKIVKVKRNASDKPNEPQKIVKARVVVAPA